MFKVISRNFAVSLAKLHGLCNNIQSTSSRLGKSHLLRQAVKEMTPDDILDVMKIIGGNPAGPAMTERKIVSKAVSYLSPKVVKTDQGSASQTPGLSLTADKLLALITSLDKITQVGSAEKKLDLICNELSKYTMTKEELEFVSNVLLVNFV